MNANVWFDMPVKGNAWRVVWIFVWALLRRQPSVRITINNAAIRVTHQPTSPRSEQ